MQERFATQMAVPSFGAPGQDRLAQARVVIVGMGGLGCPVALYLATAGVGHLTLVDDDIVEVGNLHRQVLYADADVGCPKVTAAARALEARARCIIEAVRDRVDDALACELAGRADLVIDATDDFAARYALNRACVNAGVALLSGSLHQEEGQVGLYQQGACYGCLYPRPPKVPTCDEAGVLGPVAGWVGTWMAVAAMRQLAGGKAQGILWSMDGVEGEIRTVRIPCRPDCPTCRHGLNPVPSVAWPRIPDGMHMVDAIAWRSAPPGKPVGVVCDQGRTAVHAALALRRSGHDAFVVSGGRRAQGRAP